MSKPSAGRETAVPNVRRRLPPIVVGTGLVVAVAVVAAVILYKKPGRSDDAPAGFHDDALDAAVAAVDRADPRWRFTDLEADRTKIPAALNSAPLVLASHVLIPNDLNGLDTLSFRQRLRKGELLEQPRTGLGPARPMLLEARKLATFDRGRYEVQWNLKDPLATELPHLGVVRDVVDLLSLDAEVWAHEGQLDEALVSVRAALIAARSIGDEPSSKSQIARAALRGWDELAVQALEESLRRGPGDDGRLLGLQVLLLDVAAEPILRITARAERAGLHDLMTSVEKSGASPADLLVLGERAQGSSRALLESSPAALAAAHAWLLDYTTKYVAVAELPPRQQLPALRLLSATLPRAPHEAQPLVNAVPSQHIGETCLRRQALLLCAAAGVALERYRLAHAGWPDKLGDLVPKYLAEVPTDPFDGQALRYLRVKDGVIVHSVGPEGKDLRPPADLTEFEKSKAVDISFRLWNVETRTRGKK
jgi:hypothetical protein